MIDFYSTKNPEIRVPLEEAVMKGLAEDGGLFMPHAIPKMPEAFFNQISSLSFPEMAYQISQALLQGTIPARDLQELVGRAINFDAPLKEVSSGLYALELFHGPTLSFKDFGARFMAQLMGYFVRNQDRVLHILAATSGDTGSAIGQAFWNVPGIHVWILYPKGKVSWSQEKQLTTIGHNVTALEIEGTFDDCQRLVKQAFSDHELRQRLCLTSANSINIARLIPQSFYYFYAYAQMGKPQTPVVFSIPCGNFGNLTAGLLAKRMGLPVHRFVAATNINDSVPHYLRSGVFAPHPSKHTLSNAMDVGNPSNFARMLDLYHNRKEDMEQDVFGISVTDQQTESTMRDVFAAHDYLLDPHGAVAYSGLKSFMEKQPEIRDGIFLGTAHPAKFADDVARISGCSASIPDRLQAALAKQKQSIELSAQYEDLKEILF